eukprot:398932-Pyramimonas_sp.AAC.1
MSFMKFTTSLRSRSTVGSVGCAMAVKVAVDKLNNSLDRLGVGSGLLRHSTQQNSSGRVGAPKP